MRTPVVQDEELLRHAAQGVLDYLASSLQARRQPELQQFKQWLAQEGGIGRSLLIGQKSLATARQAALFNGFQAHLLDYDDVHADVRGHPSAVILSALFASIDLTESAPIDSRRFLSAYIIGVEVMARFGKALNPSHYLHGWHSTATLGGIAAACALCYLHEYPFFASAPALAATQASGLRLLFGTPIKALHAGIAAQGAIQSVEWLKCGLTAEQDIFDEQLGFFAVFGEKNTALDLGNWGETWQISQLWFKTYPYCSAAAGVAEAAVNIRQQLATPAQVEDIEDIQLIFHPKTDAALRYRTPKTRAEGRFSAEYVVANTLHRVPLDFQHFAVTEVSPEIQQFMAKIHRTYAPSPENPRAVAIKVRLKNQTFLEAHVAYPKGSPQNPYSADALQNKLFTALNHDETGHVLLAQIQRLKQGVSMQAFIQFLRLI
ncbi:MmgE/PrpD family protein [Aggregatibacter actinomycetemcomitans]|nr:MmgE/PrpD family protein [Aggregatibacter actinomycetemcomitans]